jgi:hypothetical protein
MSKSKVKDPLLSMEWKKLSDSRALMRNALESVNHIKAGEAEAIAAGVRSLNDSLVLAQQAKALLL